MDADMNEVPNFLPSFEKFRLHCDGVDYNGLVNPVDGVFYPGVSVDIPSWIMREVLEGLTNFEGAPIALRALFLRLSPLGVEAPHQAHTDAVMGERSMMLYMNRFEDCRGGTSLVRHESGLDRNPVNESEEAIWKQDTNNPDAWEITQLCEMEPNKAFIFDAGLMHRAEPVGGFGTSPIDARLVLTAFYDR
jgi:hypothetical protein